MRSASSPIVLLAASLASATSLDYAANGTAWSLSNFKNIVTFGDSYTDENRLGYFSSHNGSAPPVGWEQPVSYSASTGGRVWPRYASIYSNTTLYNYAVSGAVCSNEITPRWFSSINAPFPDIKNYELPAFLADMTYTDPTTSDPFFSGTSNNTAYAIWIGTNDIGNNAFLTDAQVRGKTLTDYMDCVYNTVDGLYQHGARYFILMNLAPLQLAPQYATPQNGGLNATQYYQDKASQNITQISYRMWETVDTLNSIYDFRTPYSLLVQGNWTGARIANFDVNSLITDIWEHPEGYLNGTAPLNVTGIVHQCDLHGQNCTKKQSPDSYLWYDELHPSEQTDRIVAREFVGVMGGQSKWASYWG